MLLSPTVKLDVLLSPTVKLDVLLSQTVKLDFTVLHLYFLEAVYTWLLPFQKGSSAVFGSSTVF